MNLEEITFLHFNEPKKKKKLGRCCSKRPAPQGVSRLTRFLLGLLWLAAQGTEFTTAEHESLFYVEKLRKLFMLRSIYGRGVCPTTQSVYLLVPRTCTGFTRGGFIIKP